MNPWIVGVAVAYLAASLVVGMWPGRKQSDSAEGYVAGDRSLNLLVMYFITGATIFSSFAFLGAPGHAYDKGAAAFYILGYGVLGFVPFYFLAPRAARLGRAFGYVTQAEMVAERFAMPSLALVMAVLSVLAFVPYLALQMHGAGIVISIVTDGRVPIWLGAALVYMVVLIYVLASGVLGVGWTNTFQGIFMLALAWGLGLYLPWKIYGGVQPMFEQIAAARPDHLVPPGPKWSWGEYSGAVIASALGFSVWPHLFMKAFSAKSDRTLKLTVVLYPTFQIFLVPLFLIGFAGVLFATQPAEPDQILPHMLTSLDLPPLLVGLFCAGALAASMSSGDAMVHAAASIAVRDGWVRGRGHRTDPHRERQLIRWVVLAVMLLGYATALFAHHAGVSIVRLLLIAYGPIVQFVPAVVATLYLQRVSGLALLVGLVGGAAVTIFFAALPAWRPLGLHGGLWGLAVNLALVGLVSRFGPPADRERAGRFLAVARGEEIAER
jgi:solute:Na+ symporter, SSS family